LRVVDVDPEFFAALASDGVCRGFAWLDVASDDVPAVGVVTASWVPMRQEQVPISDETPAAMRCIWGCSLTYLCCRSFVINSVTTGLAGGC
jgi:hypothetical protein